MFNAHSCFPVAILCKTMGCFAHEITALIRRNMSAIRLSNAILSQRSVGNAATVTPVVFLFLKERARADKGLLYTYWGKKGLCLDGWMDATIASGACRDLPGHSKPTAVYIRVCRSPYFNWDFLSPRMQSGLSCWGCFATGVLLKFP